MVSEPQIFTDYADCADYTVPGTSRLLLKKQNLRISIADILLTTILLTSAKWSNSAGLQHPQKRKANNGHGIAYRN